MMSVIVRRTMLLSFVAAALGVLVLSAAWACTGQPQVYSVTPLNATAGSEVTMRGGLVAPNASLELRWNGVAGPKLAETVVEPDGTFAMSFAVPDDAEPGVHSVVAVSPVRDVGVGRTAFEVVADPRADTGAAASQAGATQGFVAAETVGLDAAAPSGASTALVAGTVLLSLGAAGLFAGFTVATLARRRAYAARPRG